MTSSTFGATQHDHETPAGITSVKGTPRGRARTKPAYRTTEFIAYAVVVVGVLLASAITGGDAGSGDPFRADQAWFYVALLTIGYMLSRGLAKAGRRGGTDA
ncbi:MULTISPECIES: hypothetical protein [Catenuloplanes]|uniref:Uncharacterized protein n=1 Tax=Catenuloplanes niger TaxID=587534 RepID=A0AAE3ZPC3_9ACTN|nr:hypothetical protein [Catenuloplanes niger]MDR7322607.1 hypothetical protein [Catenuloplanes niger]